MWKVWENGGFFHLLVELVGVPHRRFVRGFLPQVNQPAQYGGIPVPDTISASPRFGDFIVPWSTPANQRWYEVALLRGIRNRVESGDKVLIVGGGNGITAVAAAEEVGGSGHVIVFEAGYKEAQTVRQVAKFNNLSERITVRHAIVGEAIHSYSSTKTADHVPPVELPDCDVLELDCEGSERNILEALTIRPSVILVETHGVFDAPTNLITEILDSMNYQITQIGVESVRDGVDILKAIK